MSADPRIARLSACYTSVVHDVMRAMGRRDFTLSPDIAPLQPEKTLCGPALTVEGRVVEADAHETLLAWTGLLGKARAGHVWVCQPNTREIALMGELSAEVLQRAGMLGCVIDGALRDAGFILELGFPCWRTHHTPRDLVGKWLPAGVDVEIEVGGVSVAPGDWLHGDRDGMVRIAAEDVDAVIEAAETAMGAENKVRSAILAGMDPQEAYIRHGKF